MKNSAKFCSDCMHFKFTELIDERFPMLKRGRCSLHNKNVDNRWETNCKNHTEEFSCLDCIYYQYDEEIEDDICTLTEDIISYPYTPCEDFEE